MSDKPKKKDLRSKVAEAIKVARDALEKKRLDLQFRQSARVAGLLPEKR